MFTPGFTGHFARHKSGIWVRTSGAAASPPAVIGTPTLSSISPTSGPTGGGTSLTVAGANFVATSLAVLLGGSALTSMVLVNTDTITGKAPAHSAGAASVSITTAYGSDTLVNAFTYGTASCPDVAQYFNSHEGTDANTLFADDFCRGYVIANTNAAGETANAGWYCVGNTTNVLTSSIVQDNQPFGGSTYMASSGLRPGGVLASNISAGASTITLLDASTCPTTGDSGVPWGIGGTDYNMNYTGKSGNTLTGVTGCDNAHSAGDVFGHVGGRYTFQHAFTGGASLTHFFFRYYVKPLTGYIGGHEKMLEWVYNGLPAAGGQATGLFYNYFGSGQIWAIPYLHQTDWLSNNIATSPTMTAGHYYFIEVEVQLNTPGVSNGVYRAWVVDGGTDGSGFTGSPTLRSEHTDVFWINNTNEAGYTITGIWLNNWANKPGIGEMLYGNLYASQAGPIGYVV